MTQVIQVLMEQMVLMEKMVMWGQRVHLVYLELL